MSVKRGVGVAGSGSGSIQSIHPVSAVFTLMYILKVDLILLGTTKS